MGVAVAYSIAKQRYPEKQTRNALYEAARNAYHLIWFEKRDKTNASPRWVTAHTSPSPFFRAIRKQTPHRSSWWFLRAIKCIFVCRRPMRMSDERLLLGRRFNLVSYKRTWCGCDAVSWGSNTCCRKRSGDLVLRRSLHWNELGWPFSLMEEKCVCRLRFQSLRIWFRLGLRDSCLFGSTNGMTLNMYYMYYLMAPVNVCSN